MSNPRAPFFWPLVIVLTGLCVLFACGCAVQPKLHPNHAEYMKLLLTPKPATQPLHRIRPGEYPVYDVGFSK